MPRRIIFPEKGKTAFETYELPGLKLGDVKVKTKYSLMSIGTETIILNQKYDADTHFGRMFSFPQLKTGVQALGEVIETGTEVSEFSIGDMVYMREAHGSHQVLAADLCSLVPEGMDHKEASWCGLAKTAFRAAWAAPFAADKHVLIIGAGPLGQMATRWAACKDVAELAVIDLSEQRLVHAVRGGAVLTFNGDISECMDDIKGINNGNGPDVVIDVTGNSLVFSQALKVVTKFGKVVLLGDTGYPSKQCLSSEVMTKGITIQATHDSHDLDGWTQRRVDELFFQSVREKKFNLSGLITHEYSPEACEAAYQLANEHRGDTMGILFDWTGEEW